MCLHLMSCNHEQVHRANELEDKINKAIEYIITPYNERNLTLEEMSNFLTNWNKGLLEILKGGKMTFIDILNNIAKDKIDKNPDKIKYEEKVWVKQNSGDYKDTENDTYLFDKYFCHTTETLNEEVEIIKEDKKIEKLHYKYMNSYGNISQHRKSEEPIIDKINEIIVKLNNLKSDNNE